MIALQIQDTKAFMKKLFLSDYFDVFQLSEANFVTFNSFHISGQLHKAYYSKEELEQNGMEQAEYSTWKQVRPFCLSLIRGTHTPLEFKIVFRLSSAGIQKLLQSQGLSFSASDIDGFFLNLHFDGTSLTCTTGTSMRIFTLDRSPDLLWDSYIRKCLSCFC